MYILKRFAREPLVLFGLTAAVVFALHAFTTSDTGETIEITAETISGTIENREMLIGRPLSKAEKEELVNQIVEEEILVREAAARGFHLHDSKTRARLVTQMHFVLSEDAPEPTAQDLSNLQATYPERYLLPESVTFDHIFFEADENAANSIMAKIAAGGVVSADEGDKFWLGGRLEYYSPSQLLTVLGPEFASSLKSLTPDVWSGPIRSRRGWHIVRLEQFFPPALPPQLDLDRMLREDWKTEFRKNTMDMRVAEMRQGYRLILPEAATSSLDLPTTIVSVESRD